MPRVIRLAAGEDSRSLRRPQVFDDRQRGRGRNAPGKVVQAEEHEETPQAAMMRWYVYPKGLFSLSRCRWRRTRTSWHPQTSGRFMKTMASRRPPASDLIKRALPTESHQIQKYGLAALGQKPGHVRARGRTLTVLYSDLPSCCLQGSGPEDDEGDAPTTAMAVV